MFWKYDAGPDDIILWWHPYDAVSDLMHNWVAQTHDFKSALKVVKMVLNTQCYQYLWLTMWYYAKWSIIKGHRLSRECDILLILCSNLLSGILCLLSLILKMLGKIIWFVDVQTKYFPDEDNWTRSFVPLIGCWTYSLIFGKYSIHF